jgi:hypothetical protein
LSHKISARNRGARSEVETSKFDDPQINEAKIYKNGKMIKRDDNLTNNNLTYFMFCSDAYKKDNIYETFKKRSETAKCLIKHVNVI